MSLELADGCFTSETPGRLYNAALHSPRQSLTREVLSIDGSVPLQTNVTFNPGIIFAEYFFSCQL